MKIDYLKHFETVQIFFFSENMVVISVYTYGVKIIKKFRRESGFLGGSMDLPPPRYALTEVR